MITTNTTADTVPSIGCPGLRERTCLRAHQHPYHHRSPITTKIWTMVWPTERHRTRIGGEVGNGGAHAQCTVTIDTTRRTR